MLEIAPKTTIELYESAPFESNYENTVYFANVEAQNAYFDNYGNNPTEYPNEVKYTFYNQTYHRWKSGKIKVQCVADYLYDCNYMRFKNNKLPNEVPNKYADKWFYANVIY